MDCEWKKKKKIWFHPLINCTCIVIYNRHVTYLVNNNNEWCVAKCQFLDISKLFLCHLEKIGIAHFGWF
jgi:hypothetical protein